MPSAHIAESILMLRGHRVLVDRDLAAIYGAATKRLNEAVKRNAKRFPEDFMFQLTAEESEHLRSHFATSNWGDRRNALGDPSALEPAPFPAPPDRLYGGLRKQTLVVLLRK